MDHVLIADPVLADMRWHGDCFRGFGAYTGTMKTSPSSPGPVSPNILAVRLDERRRFLCTFYDSSRPPNPSPSNVHYTLLSYLWITDNMHGYQRRFSHDDRNLRREAVPLKCIEIRANAPRWLYLVIVNVRG